MFPADEDNVDDAHHHRIPGIPGRHRAPVLDNPRAAMEALDLLVRAEDSDSSDVKSSSLVILVGGDARHLGVQVGQVVRGGGLVSPGPGGEGGVVLGAQQEAGAGPRTELPVVEDRSHPTPPHYELGHVGLPPPEPGCCRARSLSGRDSISLQIVLVEI